MPDPTFLQTPYRWHQRQMVWFGGLPVPVTNTVLPWVDLNDRVAWSAVGSPQIDNTHISNKTSQLAWRGKGIWLAQDFVGRKIRMAMHYDETCGVPFSRAKAYLTQTGEQYVSFDGGLTGLPVRTNSFAESTFLTGAPEAPGQYVHQVELEWLSRDAFAQDVVRSSYGPVGLVNGNNGVNVPYPGMVFGEPVFVFNIPAQNYLITGILAISNSSGEQLNAFFNPPLAAHVAHTVVIGSDTLQIFADGVLRPPSGSFPYLYPSFPPPLVNAFNLVIYATGATSGITVSISWQNRWEI